jgi:fimbrial chaperone protein
VRRAWSGAAHRRKTAAGPSVNALRLAGAALAFLLLLCPRPGQAASFQVDPVRVHLEPGRVVETLVVRNDGEGVLRFEATLLRWEMAADGSWVQTPSDDLVLHPQYLEVPARGEARMRVGTLDPIPADAPQRAYRIELMQQADPAAPAGTALQMLTKVSLPVFVGGTGPARPVLRALRFTPDGLSLALANQGGRYLPQQAAQVRLLDAAGRELAVLAPGIGYVLPGAELPLRLPLPAHACRAARVLELVPAEGAPVRAELPAGERHCGR